VPVRAQVGELGAGVGEQVVGDDEQGVADRDEGALLAAAARCGGTREPRKILVRVAPMAASPWVPAIHGLPFPVPPALFLSADCFARGANLAHVNADLSDELPGGGLADAGDLVEWAT
jgi:hypothetical protein